MYAVRRFYDAPLLSPLPIDKMAVGGSRGAATMRGPAWCHVASHPVEWPFASALRAGGLGPSRPADQHAASGEGVRHG